MSTETTVPTETKLLVESRIIEVTPAGIEHDVTDAAARLKARVIALRQANQEWAKYLEKVVAENDAVVEDLRTQVALLERERDALRQPALDRVKALLLEEVNRPGYTGLISAEKIAAALGLQFVEPAWMPEPAGQDNPGPLKA